MKEIRLHGRGGQGAVMGAEMLAYAFMLEKKYAFVLSQLRRGETGRARRRVPQVRRKADQGDPSDLRARLCNSPGPFHSKNKDDIRGPEGRRHRNAEYAQRSA